MHRETRNPAALHAPTGSDLLGWAASGSDLITSSVAINRLRHRFGYPAHVAALLVELAGIGPQVRS
jgi:hypothetical protein